MAHEEKIVVVGLCRDHGKEKGNYHLGVGFADLTRYFHDAQYSR